MTLVVNFFAGPGTGKSTTMAGTFALQKQAGVNCEQVHEFAKDLTWEDRHKTLRYQPYVTAKQMWHVHRLFGEVDVILTDSPILLGTIYKGEGYTKAFENFVIDTFKSWKTLNILLKRNKSRGYMPAGRSQSETEAMMKDHEIWAMLERNRIDYVEIPVLPGLETPHKIHEMLLK